MKIKRFPGLSAAWLLTILLAFFSPVSSPRSERVVTQTSLAFTARESTNRYYDFHFQTGAQSVQHAFTDLLAIAMHHTRIFSLEFIKHEVIRDAIKVSQLLVFMISMLPSYDEAPSSH